MKVVLVGCGSISDLWLKPLKTLPELTPVALVDLNGGVAQAQADKFGLDVLITTSLDEALKRTSPDLVFNCTVPAAHFEVTTKALNAGCHVFSEKPLADNMGEAQEMLRLAQDTNKTFAVMQNRRYNPNVRALKTFLDTDAIGDITTVNADFFIGAHFGGFREQMAHVLVKDMAIHTFDMARFLSGRDARAVYCHEWNPANSWYSADASAQAIFELTSGVVFGYRGSWASEGLHTPWESTWRVVGTKGSLLWDGGTGLHCEVVTASGSFFSEFETPPLPELVESDMRAWHGLAIEAFVGALDCGETPETAAGDNIKSLAMVYGATKSAETKQRVEIEGKL